jgi:ATP-binding cassette subfamily B protein
MDACMKNRPTTGMNGTRVAESGTIAPWIWPVERLGDAISALTFHSGLSSLSVGNPTHTEPLKNETRLERWLDAAGRQLGVEVHAVAAQYWEVDGFMTSGNATLVRHTEGFLAIVGVRGNRLMLAGPNGRVGKVHKEQVRAACRAPWERTVRNTVGTMLERARIPVGRRDRATHQIVRSVSAGPAAMGGWILRLLPETSFWRQLRHAGLVRLALLLVGAHAMQFVLFLLSWWAIGLALLQGRASVGWLTAWAILLATVIPLRMLATWYQGRLGVEVGALLKRRLLFGAMRMDPDTIRHEGVGRLLGRSLEAEMVEIFGMNGGIASVLTIIEIAMAGVVLAVGAAGVWHAAALLVWLIVALWIGGRLASARAGWTERRIDLTEATVELMVGHRTRLVQCLPERWHRGEDDALWSYLAQSKRLDRWHSILLSCIPYGWLILGIAVLAPWFIAGTGTPLLAVSVGGVLLAWQSFEQLANGLHQLVAARIAWRRVAPLFDAAALPDTVTSPDYAAAAPPDDEQPLVEACALSFRYPERAASVLEDCDLVIHPGDRILLQGPSGGGKSTLAALLLGARSPNTGLLLAHGLDLASLGETGWRQRVTSAPQFHENHIFNEPFSFNLLMGHTWPASEANLDEARAICEELGLGPLLMRMPSEMLQMVGESGWQLSHGERSRVYIARALLQDCELVILDESFAALDPENLARAMNCARARAKALVVIAHP